MDASNPPSIDLDIATTSTADGNGLAGGDVNQVEVKYLPAVNGQSPNALVRAHGHNLEAFHLSGGIVPSLPRMTWHRPKYGLYWAPFRGGARSISMVPPLPAKDDFSASNGSIILLEHLVEHPLLLPEIGAASIIVNTRCHPNVKRTSPIRQTVWDMSDNGEYGVCACHM